MNASVDIETITPTQANTWLNNKFEGQRKVRENHVHRLAATIKNGDWRLTCDAITIINGKLGNGQHRCQAIALAGKAVDALVFRTTDKKIFDVIDSGIGRTLGDVMSNRLDGHGNEIMAATNIILAYDRNLLSKSKAESVGKRNKGGALAEVITRQDKIDFAAKNGEALHDYVVLTASLYAKTPVTSKSIAAAFLFIAARKNEKQALAFVNDFYMFENQSSASDLGKKLFRDRKSNKKSRAGESLALMLKAFKLYLKGERKSVYRMGKDEEFPTL